MLPPISVRGELQLIGIDNVGRVVGMISSVTYDQPGHSPVHIYWLPPGGAAWVKTNFTINSNLSPSLRGYPES